MQKITVRTLLRALAMSPFIGLVLGRGRAQAAPAQTTPADPLTVDDQGVTVKGQLNADQLKVNGVTIEGQNGRNFFSDSEKKGFLRVGAWGGFPAFIRKLARSSSGAKPIPFF
jgi:hypothetical protein